MNLAGEWALPYLVHNYRTDVPPGSSSLANTLRLRRFEALLDDAELTRDHPETSERMQEGQRLVREAMYYRSLGRITQGERDRLFAVLSFAVEAMQAKPDELLEAPNGSQT